LRNADCGFRLILQFDPQSQSSIRNRQLGWLGSNQVTTGREPNAFRQEEGGPKLKNGRQSSKG